MKQVVIHPYYQSILINNDALLYVLHNLIVTYLQVFVDHFFLFFKNNLLMFTFFKSKITTKSSIYFFSCLKVFVTVLIFTKVASRTSPLVISAQFIFFENIKTKFHFI